MERFKQNDPVYILPKFAKLYRAESAVVMGVTADPFRSMFDTYTVKFADESTDKIFDFQIIEDVPDYETFIAAVAFDSQEQSSAEHTQDPHPKRQVILQTPGFEMRIDIRINKLWASIAGQLFERNIENCVQNLQIRLMKDGIALRTATSDGGGLFKFSEVSRGALNILVVIPEHHARILGTFSV